MIEELQAGDKGYTRAGQKIKVTEILPKWAGKYPVRVQVLNTMGTFDDDHLTIHGEVIEGQERPNDFVRKADWL